ncbi:MAG: pilus assembly protein [Rickettsiales bacterium]|nr:pilus assembly protein [Rickettsiales bacterium]
MNLSSVNMSFSSFKRLLRDTRAVAAIEFAIVFPVFIYIVFFLMELCLICFSAITIENAVAEATRTGKIGTTAGGLTRDQFIRQEVRAKSYGLINADRLAITSTTAANATIPDYDSVTTDDFCIDPISLVRVGFCPCATGSTFIDNNSDGVCTAPGGGSVVNAGNPGDIVRYTVTYRWRVLTPIIPLATLVSGAGLGIADAAGDLRLVSGGAVRNELFP